MILIVDDKPENIFSLKRTLELNGFSVDTAESGEDALKKILKNNDYSLIILDVQMPGMDGFEVADAISGYSKAKDIPIIFLSAVNTDKKFIAKGYTSGGVDYVTKPVDPDIFILKVKTLHRLYEQNRELNRIHIALRKEVEVRTRAEESLNAKVEELRSILEVIPQAAFTLKPDGSIEFVNEYWFLYSNEAGKLPRVHDQDAWIYDKWKESIQLGKPLVCEVRIRNIANNEYRYHLLKLMPIRQRASIVKWVGTFTDIHEQKSANEYLENKINERTRELMSKNKELESSNHELQQFAYVASHDLKEPLRKVQIFSSILKDKYEDKDPDLQDHLSRIIKSSRRMGNLINDLLDYSRLSKESFYQPVNLNDIIADILPDLELIIEEKEAIIDLTPIPIIDAIPGQMRQVFQNLISNSLKFSREGVPPQITIAAERVEADALDALPAEKGPYCRILLSDNGIGFNSTFSDKIFTIFQRLHGKEEYEGNGIGLAIVKKIVEKHNGSIYVESKENQGTEFIIILPVHQTNISK
ncbi:MAG: response regulator [Bacteroidetes bacterium]|nr:response regulator [Bacteroidota bacterium]